jgi:hypothetical protein
MRSSPALTFTVERFTFWRLALGVWVLCTAAALFAWALLMSAQWGMAVWLVALALTSATGWVAARLSSTGPVLLHWDRQSWRCGPGGSVMPEPASGTLDVTIDLGAWMMLRFTDQRTGKRRWIAVQRSGLEGQWHALRCAVYSPRPEAGGLPDDPSDLLHGAAAGASHRASPRIDPAA